MDGNFERDGRLCRFGNLFLKRKFLLENIRYQRF